MKRKKFKMRDTRISVKSYQVQKQTYFEKGAPCSWLMLAEVHSSGRDQRLKN